MGERNIIISILLILGIILIGSIGYMKLENLNFLDALYFTIVTVSSVGYGDIYPKTEESKIFSIFIILVGVSSLFYLGASIISTIVEGKITSFIIWHSLAKIRKMKNHVILCGYGDVGSLVAKGLDRGDVVIIERDKEKYEELTGRGYFGIHGDSTHTETLRNANIEEARALIIALNSDADAIYTILSAKELNPEIKVYVRANESDSLRKMKRAGANYVICLPAIGSREILNALRRED